GVPPQVGLPLAPRPAFRVRRGPVVEDAAVARPRPPPLRRHPRLLAAWPSPGRLVDPAGVAAAVDPAAARRAAVVLQLRVRGQCRAVRADAADLTEHRV